MPKRSHLSVRVSADEKESLERLAAAQDLTVGQLVRRTLRGIAGGAASSHTARAPELAPTTRRRVAGAARERELGWLVRHARELARFAGQWLLLDGDELVAHGEDYLAVLAIGRARGIRIPFVEKVPPEWAVGSPMGL